MFKNYDFINFILKYFYFKKGWSSQFCFKNCEHVYDKKSKK